MPSQRFPVHVKNRAGLWYRNHTVYLLCLRGGACPDQYRYTPPVAGVAINEAAIIVLRHEAYFLAFGFACHAHTAFGGHRPHLWLGVFAQGETGMRQLLLIEH